MLSRLRCLDVLSSIFRIPRKRQILWPILTIALLALLGAPSRAQQAQPSPTSSKAQQSSQAQRGSQESTRPETRSSEQATQQASPQAPAQNPAQAEPPVILPAGTQLALILTHPIDSKTVHRGDAIFAQTTAPVAAGNQVVIPAGASVQGKVEKLTRQGTRAQVVLQSASVALPDGYVVNISGPMELESGEGTAWRNPSDGAKAGAILAPMIGSGLGTAIGAAVHTTQTSNFAGMTMTTPTLKGVVLGSMTGLAAGAIVSVVLIARSRHFYVAEDSPAEMVLPRAVTVAGGPAGDATNVGAAER